MNEDYLIKFCYCDSPYTKYNKAIVSIPEEVSASPMLTSEQEAVPKEIHTPTDEDIIKGFALTIDDQMTQSPRKRKHSKTARRNTKERKLKPTKKKVPPTKKRPTSVKKIKDIF